MATKASKSIASLTGAVLSILGPTGNDGTPTAISEITDLKPTGRKWARTKTTNADSGGVERKLKTVLDAGQIDGKCNFVPNDAGQLALIAAANDSVPYDFTIQMPKNALAGQTTKGNLYAFSALVDIVGPTLALEKNDDLDFTLDIDGDWTVTAGS